MRRILTLVAALAIAACSSPDERPECARNADCNPGEFCAITGEGNVCWPDAVSPVVSGVTLTCVAPLQNGACARDGVVRVSARVTDDNEVGAVTAALSLAPETTFPLAKSGAEYVADIPLAELPFASFEGTVIATVRAADGAGNEASADAAAPVNVTRLRWTYEAGLPLSPPAVTEGGTIVVSRANTSNQALAVNADGTRAWETTIGNQVVTAAPMVGAGVIWFPSTNGTLYQVAADGTKQERECATGGPLTAPATLAGANLNRVAVGNETGALYLADSVDLCNETGVSGATLAPAVVGNSTVFAISGGSLQAYEVLARSLRSIWSTPVELDKDYDVAVAPAVDAAGNVWTVSVPGVVHRTEPNGSLHEVGLGVIGANGVVILADGSAVAGVASSRLKRLRDDGAAPPWTESAMLSGTPSAPLVLAGDEPVLLTGTSSGWLYAIRASDGQIAWSHKLGSQALRIGNVFHQPGDALPTAYFPAADGKLHAIVVDGPLDASAPWPKPYHDAQNTGNAATPID